jgi:hypothetical protein
MLHIEDDVMRQNYRPLNAAETVDLKAVKQYGQSFYDLLSRLGESQEITTAKTKIEEAVMWATKHITRIAALPVIDPQVAKAIEHTGSINLALIRKMFREMLIANFGYSFILFVHPDCEPDVRDTTCFMPIPGPMSNVQANYKETFGRIERAECVIHLGALKHNDGRYGVSLIGYNQKGQQMLVTTIVTTRELEDNPFHDMPSQRKVETHGTM